MRNFLTAILLATSISTSALAGGVSMSQMDNRAEAEKNRVGTRDSSHNSGCAQCQTFMRFFGHPAYQGGSSSQDRGVAGRTAQERSTGYDARQ